MADELLGILTGKPSNPAAIDRDTDLLVRTVAGEAANQGTAGRQAVAAVIYNRHKQSGMPIADVVTAPKQFSAWDDPKTRPIMDGLKPTDPLYRTILGEVAPVLEGKVDPTNGADHYYAPKTIAAPAWAKGEGADIGDHRFYKIGYEHGDDLAGILGVSVPSRAAPNSEPTAEQKALIESLTNPGAAAPAPGVAVDAETGTPLNAAQQKTVQTLYRGGYYDPKSGTINGRPVVYVRGPDVAGLVSGDEGGEYPTEPGALYITPDGVLAQVPGGDRGVMFGRAGRGLGRGLVDVMQSIGQVLPGAKDSDALQSMRGNRLIYDAETRGDLVAGAGRFIGQAVPTTAALVAGGEFLAPLKAASGATGTFLAGEAGAGGSGAANLLLRGASLSASGALEGAGAGALTHASNDAGLVANMEGGALAGAALKPALTGVSGMVGNALRGKAAGALPEAEQNRILQTAQNLPVPVPLSRGMISEAPAMQMEENLMLKGAKGDPAAQVMRQAAEERQGALRDNVGAIENKITGAAPRESGEGAALASAELNARRDAAKTDVNAAYNAARAVGDDAMLDSAKGARDAMLAKLGDYDLERVASVARVVEKFGDGGAPTARQLFDARSKLSTLTQSTDGVEAGAARAAIKGLDEHIEDALKGDLFLGDPKAVQAWKTAISKNREFAKLFDGDDLIAGLTAREPRSGKLDLAVSPEDAANYIFGRSGLGFAGKQNMTRDLNRLRDVLGPDSEGWNAIRGEAFKRLARAAEGSPEGGKPQISGQNFMKAWGTLKAQNPQIVKALFSPEEVAVINDFAETAQRATSSVRGGDNPSNSGVLLVKKFMDSFWTAIGGAAGSVAGPGGAAGGAAVGKAVDGFVKEWGAVIAARKALKPEITKPAIKAPDNKLLRKAVAAQPGVIAGSQGNRILEASP